MKGHLNQFFPSLSSSLVFVCELKVLRLVFFTFLLYFLLFHFGSGEKATRFGDCTELALATVRTGSCLWL